MPLFTWVVRDHTLKLGTQTDDEYMNSKLEDLAGTNEDVIKRNKVRGVIK